MNVPTTQTIRPKTTPRPPKKSDMSWPRPFRPPPTPRRKISKTRPMSRKGPPTPKILIGNGIEDGMLRLRAPVLASPLASGNKPGQRLL